MNKVGRGNIEPTPLGSNNTSKAVLVPTSPVGISMGATVTAVDAPVQTLIHRTSPSKKPESYTDSSTQSLLGSLKTKQPEPPLSATEQGVEQNNTKAIRKVSPTHTVLSQQVDTLATTPSPLVTSEGSTFFDVTAQIEQGMTPEHYRIQSVQNELHEVPSMGEIPMETTVKDEPIGALPSLNSTITQSLKQQILLDDSTLLPHITLSQSYSIKDSLPYWSYSVKPESRRELISDDLRQALPIRRRALISVFDFDPNTKNTEHLRLLMLNAIHSRSPSLGAAWTENELPADIITDESAEKPSFIYHREKQRFIINPSASIITLALYNKDKTNTLTLEYSEEVITLTPGSGILLVSNNLLPNQNWACAGRYNIKNKYYDSNPLLIETEPVDPPIKNKDVYTLMNEGEYMLTSEILTRLVEAHVSTSVCDTPDKIKCKLRSMFANDTPAPMNIIVTCTDDHTVAVRIIRKSSQLIIYIHETLGFNHGIAKTIREKILEAIKNLKRKIEIHVLTPEFASQMDLSSCGVFALKAVKAFTKRPELDQWLIETVSQTPENIVQVTKAGSPHISQHRIKKTEMPAILIKNCQGSKMDFTEKQLSSVVSRATESGTSLTLQQYLDKYRKPIPSLSVANKTSNPNFSSTCKRYKALLKYEATTTATATATATAPDIQATVRAFKPHGYETRKDTAMSKEKKIRKQLHLINSQETYNQAQKKFTRAFPQEKTLTSSIWDRIGDLESLLMHNQPLASCHPRELEVWLKTLITPSESADNHLELMKVWCQVIIDGAAKRKRHPAESICDVLKKLESHKQDRKRKRQESRPDSLIVTLPYLGKRQKMS